MLNVTHDKISNMINFLLSVTANGAGFWEAATALFHGSTKSAKTAAMSMQDLADQLKKLQAEEPAEVAPKTLTTPK